MSLREGNVGWSAVCDCGIYLLMGAASLQIDDYLVVAFQDIINSKQSALTVNFSSASIASPRLALSCNSACNVLIRC